MTMNDRELTQIVQNHTGFPWFNGKAYVEYHGIKDSQARIAELEAALTGMVGRYVELVECGDCGHWNAEDDLPVQIARAALGGGA
jgi:hypothetical protein